MGFVLIRLSHRSGGVANILTVCIHTNNTNTDIEEYQNTPEVLSLDVHRPAECTGSPPSSSDSGWSCEERSLCLNTVTCPRVPELVLIIPDMVVEGFGVKLRVRFRSPMSILHLCLFICTGTLKMGVIDRLCALAAYCFVLEDKLLVAICTFPSTVTLLNGRAITKWAAR